MAHTQIQLRRDIEADWLSADPTLALGEAGYVVDTNEVVVGDGTTAFSGLSRLVVAKAPNVDTLGAGDGLVALDGAGGYTQVGRDTYARRTTLWIAAGSLKKGSFGTPTETHYNDWPVQSLPDGAVTVLNANIDPAWVDGWSTFDCYMHVVNLGAGTGTARLRLRYITEAGDGDSLVAGAGTIASGDWTAAAEGVSTRIQRGTGVAMPSGGGPIRVGLDRAGSGDTLANAVGIRYVELVRAS